MTDPIEVFEFSNNELGYEAFISLHTLKNGMAFGGCRFSPDLTKEEVIHLSQCMSLKLASHGLPVGGAKGGVQVDPRQDNFFEIAKDFGKKAKEVLTSKVIIGKDLGATNEALDTIYEAVGAPQLNIVQKKYPEKKVPDRIRELTGYRKHMTGLGVAYATRASFDDQLNDVRVIIQGSGFVGLGTAVRLTAMGARVVGISDAHGAIYNEDGIDLKDLEAVIDSGVILFDKINFPHKKLERDELFSQEAEVLVLAATSNSVTEKMAASVKCNKVIEGSNFGLLPGARKVLFEQGVVTIPDVIASSSSAAMTSHQLASGNSYLEDDLWQKIESTIEDTVKNSMKMSLELNVDVRTVYCEEIAPELIKN